MPAGRPPKYKTPEEMQSVKTAVLKLNSYSNVELGESYLIAGSLVFVMLVGVSCIVVCDGS